MCKDIPTQYCQPDACGMYKVCKLQRITEMASMVAMIFMTCDLIDSFNDNDDDGEEWKNGS